MFPSHNMSCKYIEYSNYVNDMYFGIVVSNDQLNKIWLSPNITKWYLYSQISNPRIGTCSAKAMENLSYEELFVDNMWKSPDIEIPSIVWEGKE